MIERIMSNAKGVLPKAFNRPYGTLPCFHRVPGVETPGYCRTVPNGTLPGHTLVP